VTGAASTVVAGGALPDMAHHLGATSFDVVPTVLILGATALYVWGVSRVRRRAPDDPWPVRRTVAFLGAMVLVAVAVESFVGVYDDTLFYDHMVQHLVLIMLAAPLVALAAPTELTVRATSGSAHRIIERALDSRVGAVLGHPLTGFLLYAVLVPALHLTALYDVTLTHEFVHDNEHLLFLVVGYLFWRPVVAVEPTRHPLTPALRLAYLMLAIPIDTFSGLALISANRELFGAYRQVGRTWGPTLVGDLHIGGTIMCVAGDALMVLAMVPVALAWIRSEDLTRRLGAGIATGRRVSTGAPVHETRTPGSPGRLAGR